MKKLHQAAVEWLNRDSWFAEEPGQFPGSIALSSSRPQFLLLCFCLTSRNQEFSVSLQWRPDTNDMWDYTLATFTETHHPSPTFQDGASPYTSSLWKERFSRNHKDKFIILPWSLPNIPKTSRWQKKIFQEFFIPIKVLNNTFVKY